ncbi:MAG TPA: AAA family ATPase [Solirubrobacteraceae bacterium]
MPSSSAAPILERDRELAALDDLVVAASHGEGHVAILEGPAGIGKTVLAREARDRAADRGLTVLSAVGSELDRDFPFGIVLQLLGPVLAGADPERRARLLAGAARLAETVLEPSAVAANAADASHAALHGLYWLTANLAEQEPVVLVVDDLHWADGASVRFLEFLGRRLEGLPVLVVATVRSGEPGSHEQVLAALADGPCATVLRPGPLSRAAAAALVTGIIGDHAEDVFVDACYAVTAGNPLLVGELVQSAAERGLRGCEDEAEQVAELGATDLAGRIHRRLARLGGAAEALAGAAAILGERATLAELALLADLGEAEAVAAVDRLTGAQVLEGAARAFVHPLVREAVLAGMPPAARATQHARAARLLADRGARPDEVAVHLLAAEPAGDPWAVAMLREAARTAMAEGAADSAVRHLCRALAEPPPAAERPGLLLELGELEILTGNPAGVGHLREALDGGLRGDAAARAQAARARVLLLQDPLGAVAALEAAMGEAEAPALVRRLESSLFVAASYDAELDARRSELLEQARAAGDPSPVVHAHLAIEGGYAAAPASEILAHARPALENDALLRAGGLATGSFHLLILVLRLAEQRDLALAALEAGDAERRRTGSLIGALFMNHARAYWDAMFGSVAAAESHARAALAAAEETGLRLARASVQAILVDILVQRGALEEASAIVADMDFGEGIERTIAGSDQLVARAWVRHAEGRGAEAETDLRRARELLGRRGWRAPHKARATLRLAELLAERDDGREEAIALTEETLAIARAAELPGAAGVALRIRGRAERGAAAIAILEEAVNTLAASPLRLDHAWALHDLGAAQRRAGQRRESRDTLRAALDAAARLGAARLADSAREELTASGARLRTEALDGVAALTPSERRVAELAARGLSNREIAENLWVTRKTVEVHLGRSYGKLGIRSRAQLAEALEGSDPSLQLVK